MLDVTLACGVWREGTARRDAHVRPLPLADEWRLVDEAESLLPAELATRLIGSCAEVGGASGPDLARSLTVGDRAALLLAFRRLTAGDLLPCLVDCSGCGERFELELDAVALSVERPVPVGPTVETAVGDTQVTFRLPTGADEERAARAALVDHAAAAEGLLRSCLVDDGGLTLGEASSAVETAIAEVDPHAEIALSFTCPECGATSAPVLDAVSYVLDELQARVAGLEHEVHTLASCYGWDESEILALPAPRRRRYLELIEGVR
jgi:hypothetical protein